MNNGLKTVVLLSVLTGLLMFVGLSFGGITGALAAFVFALLLNFFSYWYSDKIVLAMYGAKEMSEKDFPNVYSMVKSLSAKAGIPTPRVFLAPLQNPNAFATGRSPEHGVICFTLGILAALDKEELEGVTAHELSHIKNRDILVSSIAATFAGALALLARFAFYAGFLFPSRDRNNFFGSLLSLVFLVIVTPLIAVILQLSISRSREFLADASSVKVTGNPQGLARALVKLEQFSLRYPLSDKSQMAAAHLFIVNPFRKGVIAGLFSTHPSTQKRVERLNALS